MNKVSGTSGRRSVESLRTHSPWTECPEHQAGSPWTVLEDTQSVDRVSRAGGPWRVFEDTQSVDRVSRAGGP